MRGKETGDRLAQVLSARRITQSRLAELVATTPATISRILAGKLGLTTQLAERISDKTGFRAGWLLTGDLPAAKDETMAQTLRATYLAGWRDAMTAVSAALETVGEPAVERPMTKGRQLSASLAAAKQRRQELVALGRVGPPNARPARRQKPA